MEKPARCSGPGMHNVPDMRLTSRCSWCGKTVEHLMLAEKLSNTYGFPENDPAIKGAVDDITTLRELLKDDKPMNPRKQYILDKTAPIRHDMNKTLPMQPRKVITLALTAFVLGAAIRSMFPLWATVVLGLVLGIFMVSRYVGKFDRDRKAQAAAAAALAAQQPQVKR